MIYLYLSGCGFLFLLHLLCENLASFVRYGFAGIGMHMQGVAISNYFGIASRGFVALYGVVAASLVEGGYGSGEFYVIFLCIALALGSVSALLLSKMRISIEGSDVCGVSFLYGWRRIYISWMGFKYNGDKRWGVKLIYSAFVGLQFAGVVVAYGACFYFPDSRLLIISFVPMVSMMGTLVTVVFVEPRLAKFVDESNDVAHEVSQAFMRARAFSFTLSFLLLILVAAIGV